MKYPNNTVATYEYDSLNRLAYLENSGPEGLISSYDYTLGPAGNRQKIVERYRGPVDGDTAGPSPVIEEVCEYDYDGLYRLTREERTSPDADRTYWIEYEYDAFGNRTEMNAGGVTTTYTYDKNDRLESEAGQNGATTYSWDANGNMTGKTTPDGSWSYDWTYDNKMARADKGGALESAYAYDFRGERISKATASDETAFLIDNNNGTGYSQALRETGAGGAEKVAYTFGDDLISQDRADVAAGEKGVSFLHYDGLGSTRALTALSASVTDRIAYLAFGAELAKTGTTKLNHLFTGEAYDFNLGYYYLRARLYNPLTGRFASLDPFSGINSDPRSLHKYLYVNNNPINSIDPSGLIDWSLASMAVALTIAAILKTIAIATLSHLIVGFLNRKKAFCPCGNWYTLGFGEKPKEYMEMKIAAERAVGSFTACCFDKVNGKSRYCIIKLECQTVHGEIKVQSPAAFYVRVFASIYSKRDWSRPDLKVGIGSKGMATIDGNIGLDVGIAVSPSASIGVPGYIESCKKKVVKCGECNPRHRSCPCGIKGPDYAEFNYRVQGQKNAAWKDMIFLLRGGR